MIKLTTLSLNRLKLVHNDLQSIIGRAAHHATMDFVVTEGIRTLERQRQLFKAGASQTMDSRHLTGYAVDLAPFMEGQVRWDWPLFYRLAGFVRAAAIELKLPLEWGAVWDRRMDQLDADLDDEVAAYVLRRKKAGRKAFLDGPHFQLPRKEYP